MIDKHLLQQLGWDENLIKQVEQSAENMRQSAPFTSFRFENVSPVTTGSSSYLEVKIDPNQIFPVNT